MTTWEIMAADDPRIAELVRDRIGVYPHGDYPARAAVVRCQDGLPVEIEGFDGGEPEDQCLWRDWSWVGPACSTAYARGLRDGALAMRHEAEKLAVQCDCGLAAAIRGLPLPPGAEKEES